MGMAVISASSTVAESLSVIVISFSLYTASAATRAPSLEPSYSTCCCLVGKRCMLVIFILVFPFPPKSIIYYIRMVVVPMGRCRHFVVVLVFSIVLIWVGDIPVSYWSTRAPFRCLMLIVVCNGWYVFALIFLYSFTLLTVRVSSPQHWCLLVHQ